MRHKSLLVLCCLFSLLACSKHKKEPALDFSVLKEQGEITAVTLYGSTSYFIYKGEEMGYDYDLLTDFAETQELKVNIKVAENEARLQEILLAGEADLIAYDLPITNEGKESLLYCGGERTAKQVLVQRSLPANELITNVTQLIGKEVVVIQNSKQYARLNNLNDELGGGIEVRIINKDTVSVEDLIAMVSSGEIAYTFSDYDLAKLNQTYYANLNVQLDVSYPQRSSWAVRKDMPELAAKINDWFEDKRYKPTYRSIVKRYFEQSKLPEDTSVTVLSSYQISIYDDLFKKYAPEINWDWRLLASIGYQESRFRADPVSWAGATGVMGLMPNTAKAYGVSREQLKDPEHNIRGAVAFLKRLNKVFAKIENEDDRLKMILASYNGGPGHISDAQALARKYGYNPHVWNDNVEVCLRMKRLPKYYNDPVCKSGYFRGTETLNYVEEVIARWHYYQQQVSSAK